MEKKRLQSEYQIVRKIAAGGMGELFLAVQQGNFQFQRQVVIKRLHPELAKDSLMRGLFIQEALVSGRFHHPNLVQVYGIAEDETGPFMVMEYIDGLDLMGVVRASIARRRFLPLAHALCIVAQVAEGLQMVHSLTDARGKALNLVHRDVTPSNILITRQGVAKLVDFGVALVEGDEMHAGKAADIVAGKVNYMAPEAISGGIVDHRVDLFGLGVILYELVLARRLFRGSAAEAQDAILHKPIPLPSAVRPDIDPELEKILLKAVDKNPDYRYQSAAELISDIENYAIRKGIRLSRLELGAYVRSFSATEPEFEGEFSQPAETDDIELDFDQGFGEGWGRSEAQGLDASEPLVPDDLDDESWLELMASPEKLAQVAKKGRTGRFAAVSGPAPAAVAERKDEAASAGPEPAAMDVREPASESAVSRPARPDPVFWAGMILLAAGVGFAIARFLF